MNNSLSGEHLLVTGGGSGIGFAIVRAGIKVGAKVSVLQRGQATMDSVVNMGAAFYQVDMGDNDALDKALKQVSDEHGTISRLVNNAGVTLQCNFVDMSLDDLESLWRINQRAYFLTAQFVARSLIAINKRGAIVNIASNHATATDAGFEAYAATKGAIVAMSRAMAWSLGKHDIRVNSLSPGITITERILPQIQNDPTLEARFDAWTARNKALTTDEIAEVAIFLLSDAAAAINGSDIIADQGMHATLGLHK